MHYDGEMDYEQARKFVWLEHVKEQERRERLMRDIKELIEDNV